MTGEQFTELLQQNIGIPPELQAKLLASLIALVIFLVLHQVLDRAIVRRIEDLQTRYFWRKTLSYTLFFFGALVIGSMWLQGIQSLSTYLGLLSAGLAIALRDIISDIIGWFYLLWRKPFGMGDRVQVGDHTGDVIDLGVFQFTLVEVGNWVAAEQSTGRMLYIPNSMVFRSVVANYTRGVPFIWNEIPVLLTFDSNWEKAKALLDEIGQEYVAGILDEAAEERVRKASNHYLIQTGKLTPVVYTSVKENGILLTLRYLCEPRKRRDSTHLIWERILHVFASHTDIRFINQPVVVAVERQNLDYNEGISPGGQ